MIRNLHHENNSELIMEDLLRQGLKANNVTNKIGRRYGMPLDMFIVSFEHTEDVKKIYAIKYILNESVVIEALRSNKILPQCKRCQAFGHTQNYCGNHPRCVKCVEKHATCECKKNKEDKAQCIHCGGAHPASYRGCIIAKELQKIHDSKMRNKSISQAHSEKNHKATPKSSFRINHVSYAHAIRDQDTQKKPIVVADTTKTLELILAKLNVFDERLKRIEALNTNQ